MTSFVGRRREVAEAKRLLSHVRVLTLTGPGGVGKTRLALRVAEAARHGFPDGVWLVELADLADPSLLAKTVADRLGLLEQAGRPAVDTIADHFEAREALLVVDNCEHLIDACALFVDTLIRGCPRVRVLATSRQSLDVYGETVLPVPPLPTPDADGAMTSADVADNDSVRLFVERGRAVRPAFDVTDENRTVLARLCRGLDGIPLAIELSAVWLGALSLEQIEERLSERYRLLTGGPRDSPARQRTLRALVDWSHQLCSRPEQLVWARVSVFAGGFDLAAAEYVAGGDGVPPADVPEVVRSLVDKSVLIRDEQGRGARYRMLETLREYGHERLVETGDDRAVRLRHRDWYAKMVERFEAEWIGPDQESWIRRLWIEHANLRAALMFSLAQPGEAVVALRVATDLDEYWSIREITAEARYWLDQALTASPEPSRERLSALCLSAWYALLQGAADAARPLLEEASRLTGHFGGEGKAAFVALVQGMAALFSGDLDRAAPLLGTALTGFRVAHPRGELFALSMLGLTLGLNGEREKGLAHLEECLALTSDRGEIYWRSWALWALAFLELGHDLDRAETAAKESLRIHGRMQGGLGSAFVMDTLAWVSVRREQHARAATLFGAAGAVWHQVGASPDCYVPMDIAHQKHVRAALAVLGEARYEAAFEHGYRFSPRQAVDFALGDGAPAKAKTRGTDEGTPLTPRETQVAALVAEGLSNKEIAARLVIATRTAETHVDHILTKLGFGNRAQVAAWYTGQRHGPPAL
ncbi:ATP-binding protein [Streptomyces sp. NPDC053513]|uniref:ATP-binding protein n=1 Tax=unclassified Streptomyces TaxID=2593676 RepID=UPI0037D348FE